MTPKIHHHAPTLESDIVGELDQDAGLALFRGIPYASVEKRWTHSRTRHSLNSPFDATEFGPRCVQRTGPVLVSGGVNDPVPGDDEFKCLNLNICVPKEALADQQNGHAGPKLPVMVWIHGYVYLVSLIFHLIVLGLSSFFKSSMMSITSGLGLGSGVYNYLPSFHSSNYQNSPSSSSGVSRLLTLYRGAFTYGANSVGRYRPQLLSLLAKNSSSPIILIQIGYRLGVFGFAASSDLASELETVATTNGYHNGDVPKTLLGNYGLIDQRNAFDWVRSHISDFGGDPSNVTAFGISAGSASIHYHILTGDPLFDRAILMSGAAPTLGPLPFKFYETAWKTFCNNSKVHAATTSERLEQLRALRPEDIAESYPDIAMGPLADGTLLPPSWRLGEPQPPIRCKEIILGDTGIEAIIMDRLSHSIPQPRFHQLVHSAFSHPNDATAFLQHFKFTSSPDLPYEAYRDALRLFLSAIMFQFPNLGIAESFALADSSSRAAYLYHFEEPSPYPGPTFGIPYHGQCALFMYQNECATYPPPARKVAEEMGRLWTAFAHGRKPWQRFEKGGRFMRFGPKGECGMADFESDATREYGYLGWLREHFEEVKEFAQGITLGFVS
jgi:carboxylesterase type B